MRRRSPFSGASRKYIAALRTQATAVAAWERDAAAGNFRTLPGAGCSPGSGSPAGDDRILDQFHTRAHNRLMSGPGGEARREQWLTRLNEERDTRILDQFYAPRTMSVADTLRRLTAANSPGAQ